MKRVVDIDATYYCKAKMAITLFFKKHPELKYWEDQFRGMAENGEDFFSDKVMADGTKNENWSYALHLDQNEDCTYIAVIERA